MLKKSFAGGVRDDDALVHRFFRQNLNVKRTRREGGGGVGIVVNA